MRFKEFVKLHELALSSPFGIVLPKGTAFGALPSYVTGSQSPDMPTRSGGWWGSNLTNMSFDLPIPTTTRKGRIVSIQDKKNPMLVSLSDGTRMFIPYDGFKQIKGGPEVGKTLVVTLQRREEDNRQEPSQIQNITVY